MIEIYKVRTNCDQCRSLSITDEAYVQKLFFDGTPKAGDWNPPPFRIYDPLMPDSDFVSTGGSAPTIPERLIRSVKILGCLERSGELLPIALETGEKYFTLNVTEVHNALDIERCTFGRYWDATTKSVQRGGLEKYAFDAYRISPSPLFKVPETVRAHVLTARNTRHRPPEEDFMSIYEREGLTGLRFEKVWELGTAV